MLWFAERAAALTSFVFFFFSCSSGVVMSYPKLRGKFKAFTFHWHRLSTGFAFAFLLMHLALLLVDNYVIIGLGDIFVPFAGGYMPWALCIGSIAMYLFVIVYASSQWSNFRNRQKKLWKLMHIAAYPAFMLGLFHGLLAGTDSASSFITALYFATGISVLVLVAFRPFMQESRVDEKCLSS